MSSDVSPQYFYVCTVNTTTKITALAEEERTAEKIAINRALEWLKMHGNRKENNYYCGYTDSDVRKYIGVQTIRIPINGWVQW